MSLQMPFYQAPPAEDYDYYNQSPWSHEHGLPSSHAAAASYFGHLAGPESWSPYTETSPDLTFSSAGTDVSTNVFDAQFGQSLQTHHHMEHYCPTDASSTPSLSPEPVSPMPISASTTKQAPKTVDEDSSRRRHPCLVSGCLRRFTSQYTLKVHMQAHKPKPRVSFLCTLGCGERFSRQHDRLRHEVAKHNKVCEFSCEACGRFFSTAKTLGNHKCPVAQGGTRWVHH
ncbi:hypothetical protein CYLTODRAFT_397913 [Cylindrobasidium torrendii FP15055 ss-10]|uniref:C2H2-type domain-containing protein n=1 Tax=Cylindrobasidium torrendii FP15055 ss-10 TaxID=1314674 RepID=A0A0D7B8P8_9AGAR|nr:hypothetical protein CYLTODRAFT_397913 [Cylindrobasidium torrendii FP15055 ss-10]